MTEKSNLSVKTFEAESAGEMDTKVNDFKKENDVYYTNALVDHLLIDGKLKTFFTYVVYYLPKVAKKQLLAESADTKPCPKCGVIIPISYEFHLKCGWKDENGE